MAGELFEYIYEPVLRHNPSIVYREDLHRFAVVYCYLFFTENGGRGEQRCDSSSDTCGRCALRHRLCLTTVRQLG